ncbi:uncharacterized protein METZ01_LOCUS141580, partial [marine metagenome]
MPESTLRLGTANSGVPAKTMRGLLLTISRLMRTLNYGGRQSPRLPNSISLGLLRLFHDFLL